MKRPSPSTHLPAGSPRRSLQIFMHRQHDSCEWYVYTCTYAACFYDNTPLNRARSPSKVILEDRIPPPDNHKTTLHDTAVHSCSLHLFLPLPLLQRIPNNAHPRTWCSFSCMRMHSTASGRVRAVQPCLD